jgi:hypothetical protein
MAFELHEGAIGQQKGSSACGHARLVCCTVDDPPKTKSAFLTGTTHELVKEQISSYVMHASGHKERG